MEKMTYADGGLSGALSSALGCLLYLRFPLGCVDDAPPSLPSERGVAAPLVSSDCLSSSEGVLRFGDARAWALLIPLVAAIFLWSFCGEKLAWRVSRGLEGREGSAHPPVAEFHAEDVAAAKVSNPDPVRVRRVSGKPVLGGRKHTYKSGSVMSRMVSHVSKPWSRKLSRYWVRPSSSKMSANSVIQ